MRSRVFQPVSALALGFSLALGACGERSIKVDEHGSFKVHDLKDGAGLAVRDGTVVTVHYTVALPDGENIIDTRKLGRSHTFKVGDGTVIKAMDQMVVGMRQGGVRKAVVPPSLHYGSAGYAGKIPPDTMLTIKVELINVRTG